MNKAILMGRLTKDPELKYTSSSKAVCKFTIAVDRRYTKQGEERQADFIPVVVWDKQAEFTGKYFRKGQQVLVVGRIQNRSWDDAEGKKHYMTEIVAEETYFADSRKEQQGTEPGMNFGQGFGQGPEQSFGQGFGQNSGQSFGQNSGGNTGQGFAGGAGAKAGSSWPSDNEGDDFIPIDSEDQLPF